jgi:hypothetical protein
MITGSKRGQHPLDFLYGEMFLFGALIALPNYLTLLPMQYPGTDSHNTAAVWRNYCKWFWKPQTCNWEKRCKHP